MLLEVISMKLVAICPDMKVIKAAHQAIIQVMYGSWADEFKYSTFSTWRGFMGRMRLRDPVPFTDE